MGDPVGMAEDAMDWNIPFQENGVFWDLRVVYGGKGNELNAALYRFDEDGDYNVVLATQVRFIVNPPSSTCFTHYQYTPYLEGLVWDISEIIGHKLFNEVRDVNRKYTSVFCPAKLSDRLQALIDKYQKEGLE